LSLIAPMTADQQAGDRPGDVEDRQVVRLRPQKQEDRVHRALGEPEAELHAEEPEVHPGDVAGGHERAALVVRGLLRHFRHSCGHAMLLCDECRKIVAQALDVCTLTLNFLIRLVRDALAPAEALRLYRVRTSAAAL
jgi:hypothetical protein